MKLDSFNILVSLIHDYPIFKNSHRGSQASSVVQLAAALHFLALRESQLPVVQFDSELGRVRPDSTAVEVSRC